MAITYPVDVAKTKWTVLQISTSEIVARDKTWPVTDGSEIPGLDPDFTYLLQVDSAQPDYDPRLYRLERDEVLDLDANTNTRTWTAIKRDESERKIAAENVEVRELERHISLEREVLETRLIVTALLRFAKGLQLPPKIQTFADEYEAKGTKFWKNRDRIKAILSEIESGQDPDLEAGFEPVD